MKTENEHLYDSYDENWRRLYFNTTSQGFVVAHKRASASLRKQQSRRYVARPVGRSAAKVSIYVSKSQETLK